MNENAAGDFAIDLANVSRRFGDKWAVRDLSIQIPAGRTFGFIGPNGAGKTTTIRMLMGMLPMSAGQAHVLGVDVSQDPVAIKRRVGYVPELHTMYRTMRVVDLLAFCSRFWPTWNSRLCDELADMFRIDLRQHVKHLSKGTLAKLSLLIALAHEPEVLILDEPMSGLDPLMRDEFLDGVLRSVCDRPRTVLFSSHMLSDVQRMADMVGIIHEGRLLYSGSTDALLAETKRIRAVLRDGQRAERLPAGTIWQRTEGREWQLTVRGFSEATIEFVRTQCPVEHVDVVDLGLEDIFKDLIRGQRVPT